MMTIARTDIVTVVMKLPDNAAPFVTRDTEAILRFERGCPVCKMRGPREPVSRPPSEGKDRTMRVEVDLWNDTPENYKKFTAKCLGAWAGSTGRDGATRPGSPDVRERRNLEASTARIAPIPFRCCPRSWSRPMLR